MHCFHSHSKHWLLPSNISMLTWKAWSLGHVRLERPFWLAKLRSLLQQCVRSDLDNDKRWKLLYGMEIRLYVLALGETYSRYWIRSQIFCTVYCVSLVGVKCREYWIEKVLYDATVAASSLQSNRCGNYIHEHTCITGALDGLCCRFQLDHVYQRPPVTRVAFSTERIIQTQGPTITQIG